MMRQVVILGAGFGGLELSTLLSDRLADEVEVTLIDENDASDSPSWTSFSVIRREMRCGCRTSVW